LHPIGDMKTVLGPCLGVTGSVTVTGFVVPISAKVRLYSKTWHGVTKNVSIVITDYSTSTQAIMFFSPVLISQHYVYDKLGYASTG
jgi:hypothetical protein